MFHRTLGRQFRVKKTNRRAVLSDLLEYQISRSINLKNTHTLNEQNNGGRNVLSNPVNHWVGWGGGVQNMQNKPRKTHSLAPAQRRSRKTRAQKSFFFFVGRKRQLKTQVVNCCRNPPSGSECVPVVVHGTEPTHTHAHTNTHEGE